MKKLIQIAVLLPLAALATGCTTPYLVDRGRDAADIFTATVGVGIGAKIRVGPVQTGLLVDAPVFGLRGGEFTLNGIFFNTMYSKYEFLGGLEFDCQMLFFGGDTFEACSPDRGKRFIALSDPFDQTPDAKHSRIPFVAKVTPLNHPYNTQIEVVVGLGPSLRLGFNPGELLDFILGWATIDIYNDDVGKRNKIKKLQNQLDLIEEQLKERGYLKSENSEKMRTREDLYNMRTQELIKREIYKLETD